MIPQDHAARAFWGTFFMVHARNFDKKGWAPFWAIFAQTHLVTLAQGPRLSSKQGEQIGRFLAI
jgi:hypothetical protein